jgi:hypothetical protein
VRITSVAVVFGATLAMSLALGGVAQASTVLDDFNRPNSSAAVGLGPNWTAVKAGDLVSNNQATGGTNGLSIYNGVTAEEIEFDITGTGTGTPYVAGVLDWDGADGYFVKVQENGIGATKFNTVRFEHGNNLSNTGAGFGLLTITNPFTTGHVDISVLGSVVSLKVTPTGQATQTFVQDYGVDYAGTGIGLDFQDGAKADNFAAAIPEPATWAMLIAGFGGVGGMVRARRRRGAVLA